MATQLFLFIVCCLVQIVQSKKFHHAYRTYNGDMIFMIKMKSENETCLCWLMHFVSLVSCRGRDIDYRKPVLSTNQLMGRLCSN